MDVPLTCGLLNETESRITSDYDATALLEKLKAGVWSAEQATMAFCKRAAIAHQLTNCLTEIFFDDAIGRAKKLDQECDPKSRRGKPLPPLFGLPVSLKDSFQVAGYDTSTGLGCYVDEPAQDNSALAAMLIDLGAVLYCKTNLPQSIMTGDSDNNVFGRTLNPRNKLLTAGGSTGGEGALLALRGSILGVGTDIGGSIRVPSLRVGVAQNDGVFTPSPPVRRGLKQVVDLLDGSTDVQIIQINLPDVESHYQDFSSYMALSGSDRTGEPVIPSLAASGLLSVPGTTLQGFFDLNVRRAEAAKTYLQLFRDNDLDVILMPPAPHTAVPLDCWNKAVYTSLWNYLDYPAIVIPVDQVQDMDFADDLSNAQFGPDDEQLYSLYTGPEQYKGASVCVQVVGYRHKDEALMQAAAMLDSIINKI
ncbi:putative general amidase-b protein [Eutypa lata UCREL1]|uniref:Putative general amidase-b protein n=1 Tax=Eutypa lata (strain UCR-EL1) TaxID=1287681 RepID=M7T4J1_EUTLA|nr:putative general amidase-b protein [Eutypa lata UCREL1]